MSVVLWHVVECVSSSLKSQITNPSPLQVSQSLLKRTHEIHRSHLGSLEYSFSWVNLYSLYLFTLKKLSAMDLAPIRLYSSYFTHSSCFTLKGTKASKKNSPHAPLPESTTCILTHVHYMYSSLHFSAWATSTPRERLESLP